MKIAIAIFAKTIGLSPIKTRLATTIGKKNAEDFYQLCLNTIEELVINLHHQFKDILYPYWVIAEKEALNFDNWHAFKTMWTGSGELGHRLNNVYSILQKKYDYVVLIGSDSPQLSSDLMIDVITTAQSNQQFIIGPCSDGGFYLFGGGVKINKSVWLQTPYSRSDTLKILLEQLAPVKYHRLSIQQDVDLVEDLYSLQETLEKSRLLPSQVQLLQSTKKLLNNLST